MASNLYDLLRLSKQLPPERQLDSGEVEWSNKIPIAGSRNVDIYKGRYLQREDVMIKVIRTVNPKDEKNVEVCHPDSKIAPVIDISLADQTRGRTLGKHIRNGSGKAYYTILRFLHHRWPSSVSQYPGQCHTRLNTMSEL
jgi:hypothetical protein